MIFDEWIDILKGEHQNISDQIDAGIRYLRQLDRPITGRPMLTQFLKEFQWLNIRRVGYLSRDQQLALPSPLYGLYHLGRPCAYLLVNDTSITHCYWGMYGMIEPLQVALNTNYPEVVCHSSSPVIASFPQTASFAYSGIPAQPAHTSVHWNVIDSLWQSLQGLRDPWVWLLLFQPVPIDQISGWHRQITSVVEEIHIRYLQPQSITQYSRAAKSYLNLLEDYLALLERSLAEGGWLSYGLALTTPRSAVSLQAALTSIFSGERSRPEPWRLRPAGQEVKQMDWHRQLTFLPSSLLALMVDFPRQEHVGIEVGTVTRFDLEPSQRPALSATDTQDRIFHLGRIIDGKHLTQHQLSFDINVLNSHLFVAGITGAGKSTTVQTLLQAAARHGVQILVIEPVKREYRHLCLPELRVFSLGDPGCSLELNPFVFEGVSCSTHLDHLKALFAAAYVLYAPMPYILEQALHEVYLDCGWDLASGLCWRTSDRHPRAWPTLSDLYYKIGEVIARSGYGPRLEPEIRAALEVRINNLRLGSKGLLLDTFNSMTLDELVAQPTVLELQGIGDAEQRAFLLGLLLTKIYEGCIARGPSQNLRLLVVIEEAHRLLEERTTSGSEDFANPQGKAIQSFADMLAEMRAYGVGLIIAEQSPTRITRQVIKNTATKIIHQLVDAEDWRLMSDSMALTEEEGRSLVSLPCGQALVFSTGMDRPLRVQIDPSSLTKAVKNYSQHTSSIHSLRSLALARILQDDKRMWMESIRLVATWLLEEPERASEAWHTWLNTLRLVAPTVIHHPDTERELVRLVGYRMLDRIARKTGRLFGWNCTSEAEGAQWLIWAFEQNIQYGSDAVQFRDWFQFRNWWQHHLHAERPFPSCVQCPHPCWYRLFVVLDGENRVRRYDDMLFGSQLDLSDLTREINDALSRLILADTSVRQPLARCVTVHVAQRTGIPLIQQLSFVDSILDHLEDDNALEG